MNDTMQNESGIEAAERFLSEYDFVRRFSFYCVPKRDLAEELAHDVFSIFVEKAEQWDLDADIRPVLVRLIRSQGAKKWRDYYRNAPESLRKIALLKQELLAPYASELENRFEQEENIKVLDALKHCIETLPEKSRLLVKSYYWNEISMADIAESLNVKASMVRQAMVRIRIRLRGCLQRKRPNEEHDNNPSR